MSSAVVSSAVVSGAVVSGAVGNDPVENGRENASAAAVVTDHGASDDCWGLEDDTNQQNNAGPNARTKTGDTGNPSDAVHGVADDPIPTPVGGPLASDAPLRPTFDLPLAFVRLLHAHVRQQDERHDKRAARRGNDGGDGGFNDAYALDGAPTGSSLNGSPLNRSPHNGTALGGPLGGSGAFGGYGAERDPDGTMGGAQLPLWDALPFARRADRPEADLAALLFETIAAPDAQSAGGVEWDRLIALAQDGDWERVAAARRATNGASGSGPDAGSGLVLPIASWPHLTPAPIPLIGDAGGTADGTLGKPLSVWAPLNGTPVPSDGQHASPDRTPFSGIRPIDPFLLTRRRRELPGLLSPATAVLAVMLGRALENRPDVAADLVHAAPVVVVRVPEGVPSDQIEGAIDMCLPCWPLPAWTTALARRKAVDRTGTDGSGRNGSTSDGTAIGDDRAKANADADPLAHVPAFGHGAGDGPHPFDAPLADFGMDDGRSVAAWLDDPDDGFDVAPSSDGGTRYGSARRSSFGSASRADRSRARSDDPLVGVPDHHRAGLRKMTTIDATPTDAKSFGGNRRGSGDKPDGGKKTVGSIALHQAKRKTVLIVVPPAADLPPAVLALADHTIDLRLPDPDALALVVRAITGEWPDAMPDALYGAPTDDAASGSGGGDDGAGNGSADNDGAGITGGGSNNDVPSSALPARFTFAHAIGSLSAVRGASGSLHKLARLADAAAVRSDDGVSASSQNAPALEKLAGYGRAKDAGLAIADDLRAYKAGKLGWSSVARGLVLGGPPGTGKSFFARALAKSAGVPLVIGSIADWMSSNDALKAMHECFERARREAPCIMFIDELDSIGNRSAFPERHRAYSTGFINALLQHLDGAVARKGVVVCAATNHPQAVDPAVLRPGRLEQVIMIDLPDVDDLIGMLRTHLTGVPVTGWCEGKEAGESEHAVDSEGAVDNGDTDDPADAGDATDGDDGADAAGGKSERAMADSSEQKPSVQDPSEPNRAASTTDGAEAGMDGADLPDRALRPAALALRGRTGAFVNACVQRARASARRAERPLTVADIEDAARNGRDRPPTPGLVRRTAVHEAGHAIVALATGAGMVEHLSLDADGGTTRISGVAIEQTAADYEQELTVLFGGRAAELVVLGDTSGGVGIGLDSDLARATRLATLMRTSFGLGDSLVYVGTLDDDFALR